jgi:hypothetical protein
VTPNNNYLEGIYEVGILRGVGVKLIEEMPQIQDLNFL